VATFGPHQIYQTKSSY